jgi:RIO-like serine/threonine protein kinase
MNNSFVMDSWMLLQVMGFSMEGQKGLVKFKQNCVKITWAFVNIMNVVYHNGILHNDLSKENIMLHLSPNKSNVVYIDLCNSSEAWYT